MDKLIADLQAACQAAGAKLTQKGPGHYHIQGALLVNYYPLSKGRTAYVAGTTGGRSASPAEAVAMAFNAPPRAAAHEKAERRSTSSRKIRKRMMKGQHYVKCHWCPTLITLDTSTLEHIVPLDRGGLDVENNWTLACEPCNAARANNMPELDVSYTIFGRRVSREEFEAHKMPEASGLPWGE